MQCFIMFSKLYNSVDGIGDKEYLHDVYEILLEFTILIVFTLSQDLNPKKRRYDADM